MPPLTRPNLDLNSSFLFDAITVGAGPAGLSAALALSRLGRPVVVFSTGNFRNSRALRAHTILSRDHQPASEIRAIGRQQIEAYSTVHFVERAVKTARKDIEHGLFEVVDQGGEKWRAKTLILATGSRDVFPDIEGYADCWGASIYQCLFCDGIERSDRPAGLLGFESPMALHYTLMIFLMGVKDLTIFSNGPMKPKDDATAEAMQMAKLKGAKIEERRIERLIHLDDERGIGIVFEDGERSFIGFLAHTPPTEVVAPGLAKDLGVEIAADGRGGTLLKRDEPFGTTNIDGVLVAGDTGGALKQFTIAMAQGVAAGGGVAYQLVQKEQRELARRLKLEHTPARRDALKTVSSGGTLLRN